jgi:hypothetical protein
MKTVREYINETNYSNYFLNNLDEKNNTVNESESEIIDTKHSISRFESRIKGNIKKHIEDAIKIIKSKYNGTRGNYGILSKVTNIGIIIDWREKHEDMIKYNLEIKKGNKVKQPKRTAIIVTIFPFKDKSKEKYEFNRVVDTLVVEDFIMEYIESKEIEITNGQYAINITDNSEMMSDCVAVFDNKEISDHNINVIIGV